MLLYNTLNRRKEELVPGRKGEVRMYFCGPTPYSSTHIGHLRPALTGDVLARHLRFRGYRVVYLSNFTDIDDKIIQRAREEGVSPEELSFRYSREYLALMARLGVDQVDRYLRVTEHMEDIVRVVEALVEKGYAYPVDGDVYFRVQSFPEYGKLSRRSLDEMMAGARVAVDERKLHPMDFALWKAAKPGEPSWPSPWGPGRPGWHIECSVMSLKYLGESFDIHGGGEDLIFPHHENEIAQSEAYTGVSPFVRYWVHNGLIQIAEEKMSKSLGNIVGLSEVLGRFSPDAVRYFMLSTHYRHPLNFSWEALEEAARGWRRFQDSLAYLEEVVGRGDGDPGRLREEGGPGERVVEGFPRAFLAALDDDLNTAQALGELFSFLSRVNAYARSPAVWEEGGARLRAEAREVLKRCRDLLRGAARVLGFSLVREEDRLAGLAGELLSLLIRLREEARRERDWVLADRVREELARLGIALEDGPQGTRWRWR